MVCEHTLRQFDPPKIPSSAWTQRELPSWHWLGVGRGWQESPGKPLSPLQNYLQNRPHKSKTQRRCAASWPVDCASSAVPWDAQRAFQVWEHPQCGDPALGNISVQSPGLAHTHPVFSIKFGLETQSHRKHGERSNWSFFFPRNS